MAQVPPPPPPYRQRTTPARGPGLALIVGIIVGIAAGIGIGALVFGSSDDGGGSNFVGTGAINLPESVGNFRDVNAVVAAKNPGGGALQSQKARVESTRKLTEAAYSKAFGGAAAAYRAYADPGLEKMPYVIAVRGPSPALTIGPVVDPAQLELGANDRDTKTVGDVTCEIFREEVTLKGQAPDPSKEHVTLCERTSPKLTVYVGGNGFQGPADLQTMGQLTDAVFTAIGG